MAHADDHDDARKDAQHAPDRARSPQRPAPAGGPAAARAARLTRDPDCTSYG